MVPAQSLPLAAPEGAHPRRLTLDAAQKIGFALATAYFFLVFTRLTEFATFLTSFRLVFVFGFLSVVVGLITGGLANALKSRQAMYLGLFTAWLMVSTLSSFWKGGSVAMLRDAWSKSLIAFLVAGSCLVTVEHCRRVLLTVGASLYLVEALTKLAGGEDYGRLGAGEGTLANANALAFHVIVMLPCGLLLFQQGKWLVKLLSIPVLMYGVVLSLQTGSRTGLVLLAVLSLLVFVRLAPAQKLTFAGTIILLAMAGVSTVSSDAWARYKTMLGDSYESGSARSATASKNQRWYLFVQSLRLTAEHPVFGVGPGVFLAYLSAEEEKEGRNSSWRNTHNGYTQVSSEAGLPAFFLYVAAVVTCFRSLRSVYRATRGDPEKKATADVAFCALLMLTTVAVDALFDNNSYQFYFPLLAGFTAALSRAHQASESQAAVRAAPLPPVVRAAPVVARVASRPARALKMTRFGAASGRPAQTGPGALPPRR